MNYTTQEEREVCEFLVGCTDVDMKFCVNNNAQDRLAFLLPDNVSSGFISYVEMAGLAQGWLDSHSEETTCQK